MFPSIVLIYIVLCLQAIWPASARLTCHLFGANRIKRPPLPRLDPRVAPHGATRGNPNLPPPGPPHHQHLRHRCCELSPRAPSTWAMGLGGHADPDRACSAPDLDGGLAVVVSSSSGGGRSCCSGDKSTSASRCLDHLGLRYGNLGCYCGDWATFSFTDD
jgi:hypothetical protein